MYIVYQYGIGNSIIFHCTDNSDARSAHETITKCNLTSTYPKTFDWDDSVSLNQWRIYSLLGVRSPSAIGTEEPLKMRFFAHPLYLLPYHHLIVYDLANAMFSWSSHFAAPPEPAAPSQTITISHIIHYNERSRIDSNIANKIITGYKIKFKKDQTGEIKASWNFNLFA